jgi:type III restriction enzyme
VRLTCVLFHHIDNSDSEAKLDLGKIWEGKAGDQFRYMMVFDKKKIEYAHTLDEAKEAMRDL